MENPPDARGRDALPRDPASHVSTRPFAASAIALFRFWGRGPFPLASAFLTFALCLDVLRRIARERVPTGRQAPSRLLESSSPLASSAVCLLSSVF